MKEDFIRVLYEYDITDKDYFTGTDGKLRHTERKITKEAECITTPERLKDNLGQCVNVRIKGQQAV